MFNYIMRGEDGKFWAVKPTAEECARHWLGLDGWAGETIYRLGSDVELGEYPQAQMSNSGKVVLLPYSSALAAAFVNWFAGMLPPGALTDTFIYGSMTGQSLGDGLVQLSPDTFNFDPKGRVWLRDFETNIQKMTLGRGGSGTDFQTEFVGPTRVPR